VARALQDRKRQIFARRLRGRGLEIGASLHTTPLLHATEIQLSDRARAGANRGAPGGRSPEIITAGERFPTAQDDAFDFVVANDVLEHVSDPIGALQEWHRIVRDGGLVMLAVPDKRFTVDRRRPRTPIEHLV
jgi:SAM-dependent methyltransferase